MHSAVIRSEASLPEGVTEVVNKREDLLHRVLQLLPSPDEARHGAGV